MKTTKLRRSILLSVFGALALGLAACTNTPEVKPPASPSPSPASSASPATSPVGSPSGSPAAADANKAKLDALVGKWNGPEGTSLTVEKKGDKYSVVIANLDGPKTFEGSAKGDVIEFTRNGKTETIKASNGADTGMKGFEKETTCVVVVKGSEGFCKK